MDEWRSQRRGGVGKKGMRTRDSDFVKSIFIANTHSVLLVFTTAGKVFPLNVYELPESGRNAKGRPIINLLSIPKDEEISGLVTLESDDGRISGDDDSYLLFISRKGLVKRTATKLFLNLRQGGMIACGVADEDALLTVRRISVAETHVMMLSKEGKCIRYDISDVPSFGRSARGNRGMALSPTDEIIDALLVPPQAHGSAEDEEENEDEFLNDDSAPGTTLLTVTELGYGKRTPFHQYRLQGRYGKGVMSYRTSATTGSVVGALEVANEDEVMLVTNTGRVIRISASSVRMVGRVSQGVRLMRLEAKEKIVDITRIEDEDEDVEEGEEVTGLELEEVGEE
jgi:DNA gyrase subunit A